MGGITGWVNRMENLSSSAWPLRLSTWRRKVLVALGWKTGKGSTNAYNPTRFLSERPYLLRDDWQINDGFWHRFSSYYISTRDQRRLGANGFSIRIVVAI